jgi:recombination protein RecA
MELDVDTVVAAIQKTYGKKEKIAKVSLFDDSEVHSKVNYWISTGSTLLDAAIKNGIPGGRISEIIGRSSTGKSAVCFSLLANAQKMGGVAVLLDTEASADLEFARVFGVDTKKLIISEPESVEQLYDTAKAIAVEIRDNLSPDVPILICADSCTPGTNDELDKNMMEEQKIASNAKSQRRGLRTLQTLFSHLGVTFVGINHIVADPMSYTKETSTGGSGWQYFPAVRIKLGKLIKEKSKEGYISGIRVTASVVKNKLRQPYGTAELIIDFKKGILDVDSMIVFARQNGLFGVSTGWYEMGGKKYRKTELNDYMQDNDEAKEWLRTSCVQLVQDGVVSEEEGLSV